MDRGVHNKAAPAAQRQPDPSLTPAPASSDKDGKTKAVPPNLPRTTAPAPTPTPKTAPVVTVVDQQAVTHKRLQDWITTAPTLRGGDRSSVYEAIIATTDLPLNALKMLGRRVDEHVVCEEFVAFAVRKHATGQMDDARLTTLMRQMLDVLGPQVAQDIEVYIGAATKALLAAGAKSEAKGAPMKPAERNAARLSVALCLKALGRHLGEYPYRGPRAARREDVFKTIKSLPWSDSGESRSDAVKAFRAGYANGRARVKSGKLEPIFTIAAAPAVPKRNAGGGAASTGAGGAAQASGNAAPDPKAVPAAKAKPDAKPIDSKATPKAPGESQRPAPVTTPTVKKGAAPPSQREAMAEPFDAESAGRLLPGSAFAQWLEDEVADGGDLSDAYPKLMSFLPRLSDEEINEAVLALDQAVAHNHHTVAKECFNAAALAVRQNILTFEDVNRLLPPLLHLLGGYGMDKQDASFFTRLVIDSYHTHEDAPVCDCAMSALGAYIGKSNPLAQVVSAEFMTANLPREVTASMLRAFIAAQQARQDAKSGKPYVENAGSGREDMAAITRARADARAQVMDADAGLRKQLQAVMAKRALAQKATANQPVPRAQLCGTMSALMRTAMDVSTVDGVMPWLADEVGIEILCKRFAADVIANYSEASAKSRTELDDDRYEVTISAVIEAVISDETALETNAGHFVDALVDQPDEGGASDDVLGKAVELLAGALARKYAQSPETIAQIKNTVDEGQAWFHDAFRKGLNGPSARLALDHAQRAEVSLASRRSGTPDMF
ncbi:MAG TPA: hypothetical protein VLJ86_26055 [Ramlibacter sp.]|nr:hypothetical protein [Ramlibacter sp.]